MRTSNFRVEEIVKSTSCRVVAEQTLVHISIDTRRLPANAEDHIFVALGTGKGNGHGYLEDAYSKGVRNFLIQEQSAVAELEALEAANYWLVDDTLAALQALAKDHRAQFKGKMVAVAGSKGKSTVKEWLATLCSKQVNTYKSPLGYNSQIGVALSLAAMDLGAEVAIVEAGVSKVGEMARLEQMILPDVVVYPYLDKVKVKEFVSVEQKVAEKAILPQGAQTMVLGPEASMELGELCRGEKLILRVGNKELESGDGYVNMSIDAGELVLLLYKDGKNEELRLRGNARMDHELDNAAVVAVAAHRLGVSSNVIENELWNAAPRRVRCEIVEGKNDNTLILDQIPVQNWYGKIEGLALLMQQTRHHERWAVVSAEDYHKDGLHALLQELSKGRVQKALLIVPDRESSELVEGMEGEVEYVLISESKAIAWLEETKPSNAAIFIRSTNSQALEEVTNYLRLRMHELRLEINLDAMMHNLRVYKKLLKPSTKIMAMVKALSYGAGGYEIAKVLAYNGIDYLAVATIDEGIELRQRGVQTPIMVMNAGQAGWAGMWQHQLEPEIYSLKQWALCKESLAQHSGHGIGEVKVHLKLETGMHRLGLTVEEAQQIGEEVVQDGRIVVQSIFSHLSSAEEEAGDDYTAQQAEKFISMCTVVDEVLGYKPMRHLLNSSGITRHGALQMDMVRLGIGLHGIDPGHAIQGQLKTVTTLKAQIMQIREVEPGESIGYNRIGVTQARTKIGTVNIGYADGLNRSAGNGKVHFYVGGQMAPTIGKVCMDMTMIDLGKDSTAREGDEVEVFGSQADIEAMARGLSTIPYEILTQVGSRVSKVYLQR